MLVVRTLQKDGATVPNKVTTKSGANSGIQYTLALMCAKNRVIIFDRFLDIQENVEWPRFYWTTRYTP